MKKLKQNLVVATAIASLFVLATSVAPAQAAEVRSTPEVNAEIAQPTDATPHCWIEAETERSACASTEEDLAAVVFQTYGIVFRTDGEPTALTTASAELSVESRSAVAPLATWVFGQVFADRDYGGYSRTFTTGRSNPCAVAGNYPDAYWSFDAIYILNDNIESVAPLSPCRIKLWADANSGGSTTGQIGSSADLGGFRNVASSLEFSR